jgi:hypothetical protein
MRPFFDGSAAFSPMLSITASAVPQEFFAIPRRKYACPKVAAC